MSVWGKIGGVAAGFALGGPLGALLGLAAGHFLVDDNLFVSDVDKKQVTFTIGVIALSAKMAKADGLVTDDEVAAFRDVFEIPKGEEKNVARLFNLAKQDVAGYQAYAKQLYDLYKDDKPFLTAVLEGLFHISMADNHFHPDEDVFLHEVAKIIGIEDSQYEDIKAHYTGCPNESPYAVLGVEPTIDDQALKQHYRNLMKENHPDKLVSSGVPKDFIAIATDKIKSFNKAYETLARERGL